MQLYTKILIGMFIGVIAGLLVGPNSSLLPQDGVYVGALDVRSTSFSGAPAESVEPLASGLGEARLTGQRSTVDGVVWAQISWMLSGPDRLRLRASSDPAVVQAISAHGDTDQPVIGWVSTDTSAYRTFAPLGFTLVNGTVWIGRLFLALIKMVVIPLVFCSLVCGLTSLGDFRKLGRIGVRTVAIFTTTTVAALSIGVTLANLIKPGDLVSAADKELLLSSYQGKADSVVEGAAAAPTLGEQIVSIVPTNPARAMADGDMLQVIFFAVMLGIALTLLESLRAKPVVDVLDGINQAMVMTVHIVMKLAPVGVATLLFEVVGTTGLSVLLAVTAYGAVVVVGLLAHLSITYGSIIRFGVKVPFFAFLRAIKEAMLVAFSTSSSSATLPVTMECCEDKLKVSPAVSSFVLPLGATVNMDGTALYQGVAAIFIAQIYGLELTLVDQVTIVGTATLASVGAAGVPGAGMVTLAMVLTAINVPAEGIALVIGVDRLLDMFRTMINVVGDSTVTAWMARLEGDDVRIVSDDEDVANPRSGFEGRVGHAPHVIEPSGTDEVERGDSG